MSLLIERPGLLTSIQAGPRAGQRHLGIPRCGPADPLSMALANRLVGNDLLAPALELTLTGVDMTFESATSFAVAGAPSPIMFNSKPMTMHGTVTAGPGDELHVGAPTSGARAYLAFAGGLQTEEFLGSGSTYLPAGFGGHAGRAIEKGDRLELASPGKTAKILETPARFQPPVTGKWAVRTCVGPEFSMLDKAGQRSLFDTNFVISARNDRMGLRLDGAELATTAKGDLASVPVFPGCIQCPQNGAPYLLGVDAQTTGGYPRVAQVARMDLHELGQLRAGDHLRLLRRSPAEAVAELREKLDYWREWLPDIESVI